MTDKKLGYFIIQQCKDNEITLQQDYELLNKHRNYYFNFHTTNYPYYTRFTHLFIRDIEKANFQANNNEYLRLNLYTKKGMRYEKKDIEAMSKLIENIIKRDISFNTKRKTVQKFFAVTPILYN